MHSVSVDVRTDQPADSPHHHPLVIDKRNVFRSLLSWTRCLTGSTRLVDTKQTFVMCHEAAILATKVLSFSSAYQVADMASPDASDSKHSCGNGRRTASF